MNIKELTNDQFVRFTNEYNDSSIYQTKEYALAMNHQNYDSLFLGLIDDSNNIKAATALLLKKENGFIYAYAPRGFLIDYSNYELLAIFTRKIKTYLSKKNVIAVKLCPIIIKNIYDFKNQINTYNEEYKGCFHNLTKLGYYHLGFNNYFEALKPRFEAIIDIDKPTDVLFENINKSFKTKIRSAREKGIEIIKGTRSSLNLLYLQTKKKYPRNLTYFEAIYDNFSKTDKIDFFCARLDTKTYLIKKQEELAKNEALREKYDERIIKEKGFRNNLLKKKIRIDEQYDLVKQQLVDASNLFKENAAGIIFASCLVVMHRDTVYLLIDGYDPKYKNFNAKHLMIWELITHYQKLGFKKFNLGGVSSVNTISEKYQGLNDFKTGFNASITEYIGDFELVTNKTKYFICRKLSPIKKGK